MQKNKTPLFPFSNGTAAACIELENVSMGAFTLKIAYLGFFAYWIIFYIAMV